MVFTKELDKKIAIVTGGSTGIGYASALALTQAGAKVVIASRRVEEGEQAAREICNRGGEAVFIPTDVSQAAEVKQMVNKTIEIYGGLDCAFNNAGIGTLGSLIEMSEADWDKTMNVNLKGIWLCLKYQIPKMLEGGGGTIVNMSSIASIVGTAGLSAYSASKGGVTALTKAAAIEYASSGIRINSMSPAAVDDTKVINNLPPEQCAALKANHPIGRLSKPEEIAEAVVWLCSNQSSFMTGHNLVIDGGYTAR